MTDMLAHPTTHARFLEWEEREAAVPLLNELAPHFPDAATFESWRAGTLASLITGFMGVVGLWAGEELRGALLVQGHEGFRTVIAVMGTVDGPGLRMAFEVLQAESRLIVWDEEVGAGWLAQLEDFGAKPYVRQTFVQVLAEVAFKDVAEDGVALRRWDESGLTEAAIAAMALDNAESLGGIFLTSPKAPTLANCQSAFERAAKGLMGEVLPFASFVAEEDGRMAGALLCVQGEHERQGMLFELYVDPAYRGRQLSRRLVMAMQRGLLAAGYTENQFLTTAANAPVHRLFRQEEIASYEESTGGFWAAPGIRA